MTSEHKRTTFKSMMQMVDLHHVGVAVRVLTDTANWRGHGLLFQNVCTVINEQRGGVSVNEQRPDTD